MITMADLDKAIKSNLFDKQSNNPFIKECSEREEIIKTFIDLTWTIIEQHLYKPGLDSNISYWKKEKINRNIQNLIAYLSKLLSLLEKDEIEKYVKNKKISFPLFSDIFLDNVLL